MLTDIVNTITFDFTCRSEEAAKTVRDEILNYGLPRIPSLLSEVMGEKMNGAALWKIGKLEIDLGDVRAEDMGTDAILHRFKELLAESIDEARHEGSGAKALLLTATEAYRDMVKELLLYGSLPWWVDKAAFPGLDEVVKTALYEDREELKLFLTAQRSNPDVAGRIKQFCTPGTVLLLNRLLPGFTEVPVVHFPALPHVQPDTLPAVYLQKIGTAVKKRLTADNGYFKSLIIDRLLRGSHEFLLPAIELLNVLSKVERATLKEWLAGGGVKAPPEHVVKIVEKLSMLQLRFIAHPLSVTTLETESGAPRHTAETVSRITRAVGSQNPQLLHRLFHASAQELKNLQKIFRQYGTYREVRKTMINEIAEHPYFLQYRLLNLIASLSFEATTDAAPLPSAGSGKGLNTMVILQRFKKAQSPIRQTLGGLSKNKAFLLNHVFSAGAYASLHQKKAVVQIMNRLPDECLQLIAGFTRLNKAEIESLLPRPVAPEAGIKKIHIENAGLCLLAAYLPLLFSHLGYTEKGQFKTKGQRHRALYLLQYLVNGRQRNYEYDLQFNKLLCGIKPAEAITGYKRLTGGEREEAGDLITSVIHHWKALKATSVQGFRRSFLQRKGILTEGENKWTLQVEKTAYDLLLDSVPWSFNLIKLPWMNKMIEVEW